MVVRCECCVCLKGRGLCDGLVTRPEESYRLWCVLVCDLGTSRMRRLKLVKGCKCRIEEECMCEFAFVADISTHLNERNTRIRRKDQLMDSILIICRPSK
jgi:hypothetical protein